MALVLQSQQGKNLYRDYAKSNTQSSWEKIIFFMALVLQSQQGKNV